MGGRCCGVDALSTCQARGGPRNLGRNSQDVCMTERVCQYSLIMELTNTKHSFRWRWNCHNQQEAGPGLTLHVSRHKPSLCLMHMPRAWQAGSIRGTLLQMQLQGTPHNKQWSGHGDAWPCTELQKECTLHHSCVFAAQGILSPPLPCYLSKHLSSTHTPPLGSTARSNSRPATCTHTNHHSGAAQAGAAKAASRGQQRVVMKPATVQRGEQKGPGDHTRASPLRGN